jgi:uncharacterized phage protein gp47/JayE
MTTTFGLTPTGLVVKTTDLIRQDINALLVAKFGASFDTSDGSPDGALAGILAERYGQLWNLAQQVGASQDPDQATGAALDALCLLTGTFRTAAKSSTATLTLTGTPATVVASQSRASTTSTAQPFATTASATITALTAWVALTVYVVGDRRTNSGNAYQCITGGTAAGAGGPTTTLADITDGSVHWRYLGAGTGAIDVLAASVSTGAIVGVSGDITSITTPVGGWSGVINILDATLGNDVQTDASLRVSRIAALAAPGSGTPNAIRAAVLGVANVTSCTVFVNNTDTVNSDSMPPHSVEVLVQGGLDAAIATVLFGQVAAGIAFQGTTSSVVVDSQGVSQTVKFSRPVNVNVYVDITVVKDPAFYPATGDALIQAAIAAYGGLQAVGKDVVAASVGAQAFTVTGVLDVPRAGSLGGALVGIAPSPTLDTTIVITSRQLAVFDTSRVVVHSSNGTP